MLALGAFLLAFLLSFVGTLLLLRVRPARRFIDVPNERSSHEAPKPRFGGIAIVGAFVAVYVLVVLREPGALSFLPMVAGALIVFGAGVLDDWRSLPVPVRFLAQGVAVSVVVLAGYSVDHVYLPLVGTIQLEALSAPFTVVFMLTSINFYNFIDGIDGLAAGSACIAGGFLALIGFMVGQGAFTLVCLALAGSAAGFLQHNFPPSRLFMGDGGSTFIGYVFASVAVIGNRLQPEVPFFVPVLILSSLYLDAGLTLLMRALQGKKILRPHHTHYYQRLLSLGLNHKQVTLLEYALTILLGVSAVIYFKAGGFFPFFLMLCWVAVFTVLILKIRSLERGDRLFWEKRTLLVVGSDLLMIAVAYFGAYFLRMNFRFTPVEGMAVAKAFPIVLVVRSACFYYYGLYRGVWKYTSTPDVVRIIKAVASGSAIILVLLVLFYRFVAFPRSLFVIEFVLLIVTVGGTRFATRLFHEYGKEALGAEVKRVGIIGAGDYGERLAREIRGAQGGRLSVVCYVDDDRQKEGLTLLGVPITGPVDDLVAICRRYTLDSLVLGIASPPEEHLQEIIALAREAGVTLESRGRVYHGGRRSTAVLFDRISRNLHRRLPSRSADGAAAFYNGKHVLLTNAGGATGPATARMLLHMGAQVTVQIAVPSERECFSGPGEERISFYLGVINRDTDASKLLEATGAQVVIHCVSVDSAPVLNATEYRWGHVVRGTDAMATAVTRHPVEAFALVSFRDRSPVDEEAAALFAVSEARVLNAGDLVPVSPKVIRLSSVLTGARLIEILDCEAESPAGASAERFMILDVEAAAVCLDLIAGYGGRALVVPDGEAAIEAGKINRLLVEGVSAPTTEARARGAAHMLFPSEDIKGSVMRGIKEVASPLYPAADDTLSAVTACLSAARVEEVEASLEQMRALLAGARRDVARGGVAGPIGPAGGAA